MSLEKCFMNPPSVHFIKEVTLQKPLIMTGAIRTRMLLLTHQTQIDTKVCTLEKNLASLKTMINLSTYVPTLTKIKDSALQGKNRSRINMMTISALHTVPCNEQSTLKRNPISVDTAVNTSVLPQASAYIREFILERNPTSAMFVKNPLTSVQILKHIKGFILERNLTNAKNAKSHLYSYLHLKAIREAILERSLTNVRSVTDPLPTVHH